MVSISSPDTFKPQGANTLPSTVLFFSFFNFLGEHLLLDSHVSYFFAPPTPNPPPPVAIRAPFPLRRHSFPSSWPAFLRVQHRLYFRCTLCVSFKTFPSTSLNPQWTCTLILLLSGRAAPFKKIALGIALQQVICAPVRPSRAPRAQLCFSRSHEDWKWNTEENSIPDTTGYGSLTPEIER